MGDLKELLANAKGFSILYVEDNPALRDNASKLLHKFFKKVYTAEDGKVGFDIFKKYKPQIVITDIKMPRMNGMILSEKINILSPDTKIIIMSAFDDKKYLYKAIELNTFRFLKKPVNITELAKVLLDLISQIKYEQNIKLFNLHIKSIFDYQSAMVLMLKDRKPVIANQVFLDFFNVENIVELNKIYDDFGDKFLEHDGFLYNTSKRYWLDEIFQNKQTLYHIKLQDKDENFKHFILKPQEIPEKQSYSILSFEDITELNLLKLFDEKTSKNDENLKDTKSMFKLLEILQRNSAKIQMHNYYKGLSITNDSIIVEIKNDSIVIKTNYLQLKAVKYEGRTYIVSDTLPNVILCEKIIYIDYDKQSIEFENIHFVRNSPIQRSTIRVVPEPIHTVTLFIGDTKFQGDLNIEDISLDAVRLNLMAFPAGLVQGDEVTIDMVLSMDKQPLIINLSATFFTKIENHNSFSVIFMFDESKKNELIKYITKRQMAIIREFKGLQNG